MEYMSMSPKLIILNNVISVINVYLSDKFKTQTNRSNILKIVIILLVSSLSMNFETILFKFKNVIRFLGLLIIKKLLMRKDVIDIRGNGKKIKIRGSNKTDYEIYPEIFVNLLSNQLNVTLNKNNMIDQSAENSDKWTNCGRGPVLFQEEKLSNVDDNQYANGNLNRITLYYNSLLSGSKLDEYKKTAQETSLIQGRVIKLVKSVGSGGGRCTVIQKNQHTVFPNPRYNSLYNEINNYFNINNRIGIKKPIAIVLNGIPGVGKTSFCDFISQKGICNNLIKVNMMNFTGLSFADIIESINATFKLTDNDLVCFDELDKYFNIYLTNKCGIIKEDDDSNGEENENGGDNNIGDKNVIEIINQPINDNIEPELVREYEVTDYQDFTDIDYDQPDFKDINVVLGDAQIMMNNRQSNHQNKRKIRNNKMIANTNNGQLISPEERKQKIIDGYVTETTNFLTKLNILIDGEELSSNIIFVFCSNNFDTIFEYASKHFDSLKDRFIYEDIPSFDKLGAIEFLQYYNSYFENSELFVNNAEFDLISNDIPNRIAITARKLSQILIKNHYNIRDTIHELKSY